MAKASSKRGYLRPYKTYVFVDKDPMIDRMRTAFQDSGESVKHISDATGVSATTIHNWFGGKTRRPQFTTVAAFLLGVGATGINFVNGKPVIVGVPTKPATKRAAKKAAKSASLPLQG